MRTKRRGPVGLAGAATLAAALGLIGTRSASGQSITGLGFLPGGQYSVASAVSADGAVVAGWSDTANSGPHAFVWTRERGMEDLGVLPGTAYSWAQGINADGSVVVGQCEPQSSDSYRAFRWTRAGGMQNLGTLPGGAYARAYAVSADGSFVAGVAGTSTGAGHAFRWTLMGGMEDLGVLPGGTGSIAFGISADGSVVVGHTTNGPSFRWTVDGGLQSLGFTPGGRSFVAYAVSGDGSAAVGTGLVAYQGGGQYSDFWLHLLRWTDPARGGVGVEDLASPYTPSSSAVGLAGLATNADGSVIVGDSWFQYASSGTEHYPAYWSRSTGALSLPAYLSAHAINVTGWHFVGMARGVSADGLTIVGDAIHASYEPEAWVVSPAPPLPVCVADFDNGTGSGHHDGSVTIDDLLYYLALYSAGDPRADLTDASGTGHGDGVTIDDLMVYLHHYSGGC